MKEIRDFVEKRFLVHPLREIEERSCDEIAKGRKGRFVVV